jgi:hypothetical protein
MSYCIKHNPQPNNWVSVPRNECEVCIKNAFDPKKCMICREKDGAEIANSLVVCNNCEEMYF